MSIDQTYNDIHKESIVVGVINTQNNETQGYDNTNTQ